MKEVVFLEEKSSMRSIGKPISYFGTSEQGTSKPEGIVLNRKYDLGHA